MKNYIDVVRLAPEQDAVIILDETQLPNREVFLTLRQAPEMFDAIKLLKVRGAPAIGVFAGYALAVLAGQGTGLSTEAYLEQLRKQAAFLNSSRPTAVNLSWALNRQLKTAQQHAGEGPQAIHQQLLNEAKAIDDENREMTRRIGEYGVTLLKDGDGVLTHCNAGYLACLGYGTATAPMYMAQEKGMTIHVYSDETRPLLQGARLTSYELANSGIDVTAICDNMASIVMKQGKIQAVMLGCDRIAANGDFANKIGTSGVAVLAQYYHIPFYSLGPSSTIDMNTPTGDDIRIEMRDPDEIRKMWYAEPMIIDRVKCFNPAFDVTDHSLVTAFVTERGIIYPPFEENFKKIFQ
jgi:methylthioribose-1-phosphate isomerase